MPVAWRSIETHPEKFQPFLRFYAVMMLAYPAARPLDVSTLLEILPAKSSRLARLAKIAFQPFLRFYLKTGGSAAAPKGNWFQPFLRFYTARVVSGIYRQLEVSTLLEILRL